MNSLIVNGFLVLTALVVVQSQWYKYYTELGISEAYGSDPRFPDLPPKSERSYEHNVTRSHCFKDAWVVSPNRALLPGGVCVFYPYRLSRSGTILKAF